MKAYTVLFNHNSQSMYSTHLNSTEPSMKCAEHTDHKNSVNIFIFKEYF
jgi:hypothetical protein